MNNGSSTPPPTASSKAVPAAPATASHTKVMALTLPPRPEAEKMKQLLADFSKKLPEQFGVECTRCHNKKKVRKDIFLARIDKANGDVKILMGHYHCAACRKANNIDFIGRPKIAGGSTKVITLDDLK